MNQALRYILVFIVITISGCSTVATKYVPSDLASHIKQARVVLVGETHTNKAHHLNQLKVIKQAYKAWGNNTAIGLEMVQQPFQRYLDRYIAGSISEAEMLSGVEWQTRWRYDFRLYRPIFEFAKQHKLPLIALNIPREVTRKISKTGIQGLNKSERQLLPKVIDTSRQGYRQRLINVFKQHMHGTNFKAKAFDHFYAAQLAWDEGMALAASKYLRHKSNKHMVILAGSGHLRYRDGIPSRVDRLLQTRSLVALNYSGKQPPVNQADYFLHYDEKRH